MRQPFKVHDHTYRGVSLLATKYFKLLCMLDSCISYECIEEDPEGTHQPTQTFTIHLSGQKTYDLMQKVFSDANG